MSLYVTTAFLFIGAIILKEENPPNAEFFEEEPKGLLAILIKFTVILKMLIFTIII